LRDADADALRATIKNGSYQQALQKFGLERQAVTEVTIDAGT
jgi:polar amino acid transport system substrate-binding protein